MVKDLVQNVLENTVTVTNLHSAKTVVISLEAPTLPKSHVHWYPSAHLLSKQETSIFSASTSTHDDRCIVIKEGNSSMCHHYLCKQKRAILVNSQKAFDFNCSHLESVGDCISPIKVFNDLADISTYPCDDSTRATLQELGATCMTNGFPVAVHVSPTMFCVFGKATTNSTAGYCHVRVTNEEIRRCSKDFKGKMTREKQQKSRRICIHIHGLLSLHILQPISENEGTCSSLEASLTDVCGALLHPERQLLN